MWLQLDDFPKLPISNAVESSANLINLLHVYVHSQAMHTATEDDLKVYQGIPILSKDRNSKSYCPEILNWVKW